MSMPAAARAAAATTTSSSVSVGRSIKPAMSNYGSPAPLLNSLPGERPGGYVSAPLFYPPAPPNRAPMVFSPMAPSPVQGFSPPVASPLEFYQNQVPGYTYGGFPAVFSGYPSAAAGQEIAYATAGIPLPESSPASTGAKAKRKKRKKRRHQPEKVSSSDQLLGESRHHKRHHDGHSSINRSPNHEKDVIPASERPLTGDKLPAAERPISVDFMTPNSPGPLPTEEPTLDSVDESPSQRLWRNPYFVTGISIFAAVVISSTAGLASRYSLFTSHEYPFGSNDGGLAVAVDQGRPDLGPTTGTSVEDRSPSPHTTRLARVRTLAPRDGCPPASCRWQARYLKGKLSRLVSPCTDFYWYVCGSSEWFSDGVETQPYAYAASAATMLDLWKFLTKQPTDRSTFASAAAMIIQRCVPGLSTGDEWDAFRQILSRLRLDDWPYDSPLANGTDVAVVAAAADKMLGLTTIVSTSARERGPTAEIMLHVDSPVILLRRYKGVFPDRSIQDYGEFVVRVMSLWKPTAQISLSRVLDIVEMEERMNLAASHAVRSVPMLNVTRKIDNIKPPSYWNWRSYFDHFFINKTEYRYSKERIALLDVVYFDRLQDILTQVTPQTLLNYIGYKLIVYLSPLLPPKKATFMLPLSHQYHLAGDLPSRLEACMYLVEQLYPQGTRSLIWSRLLSKTPTLLSGHRADDLLRLEDFARYEMKKATSKAPWMSPEEAAVTTKKNERMEIAVAPKDQDGAMRPLPSAKPFAENASLIGSYFDLRLSLREMYWTTKQGLSRFQELATPAESSFRPGFLYDQQHNELSVSPATLAFTLGTSPRFDVSSVPFYVGELLRGMFAALSYRGAHVDDEGNFRDWWSPTTKKRYLERAQCLHRRFLDLVRSYYYETTRTKSDDHGGIIISRPDEDQTFLHEVVEDGAVLQPLYDIYLRLISRPDSPALIPGQLKNLTLGQLFFVDWASRFCEPQQSNEKARELLRFRAAIPAKLRVNGALSRFAPFAAEFKCPKGSEMNPTNECSFW